VTTDEQFAAISAKLDLVITHVEVDRRLVDGFDDRLAKIDETERKLAATTQHLSSVAMRLSVARIAALPSLRFAVALLAASVIGGLTVEFARDALARKANVALQSHLNEGRAHAAQTR
jgi:hypothetical protein